jgi:hypothetical protein
MIRFVPFIAVILTACAPPSSDDVQRDQQEQILKEGTSQVGMPGIKNFRERRIMKDILELRDREGYVTYTYSFSEVTGEFRWFCQSIGYPIPYATQFTSPEKIARSNSGGFTVLPQADPNGLFSPSSAEGTWVMCKDPGSDKVGAVYSEPKLATFPWPLPGVQVPDSTQ